VPDVKKLSHLLASSQNLLIIKEHTSFKKIFRKVKHDKKKDFVFVEKPKANQMAAVILARLSGKNFYWIQNFSNPPKPGLLTRLLLNQADTILVKSKKAAASLRSQGVIKPKIKLAR